MWILGLKRVKESRNGELGQPKMCGMKINLIKESFEN